VSLSELRVRCYIDDVELYGSRRTRTSQQLPFSRLASNTIWSDIIHFFYFLAYLKYPKMLESRVSVEDIALFSYIVHIIQNTTQDLLLYVAETHRKEESSSIKYIEIVSGSLIDSSLLSLTLYFHAHPSQ
jgi:hypothetical protein